MLSKKVQKRIRRHKRIRSTVSGTKEIPRVSVFKSNLGLYVQVIDDTNANTLFSISTKKFDGTKTEKSVKAAEELAKTVLDNGIKKIVFDRGGNKYIGRIKEFADALRKAGLEF